MEIVLPILNNRSLKQSHSNEAASRVVVLKLSYLFKRKKEQQLWIVIILNSITKSYLPTKEGTGQGTTMGVVFLPH
ncbi:hypothetical protein ACF0H5_020989 [Mactra antiquata]